MRLRHKPWAEDYLKESPWVINTPEEQKGKWNELFGNSNPLALEIGMGKGQFIEKHSKLHPEVNYIGIEKYPSVQVISIQRLERTTNTEETKNLRFLSVNAENLKEYFAKEEVDQIYINFPDPWPKARHDKRRLLYRNFLAKYWDVLKEGGVVEFKTDQQPLYEFALEELEEFKKFNIIYKTEDLHSEETDIVTTEYEEKFVSMGNPIYKITFKKEGK